MLGDRHRQHAQDDGKAGDEAEVDIELVEVLVHGGGLPLLGESR